MNLFVIVFPVALKLIQVWEEKSPEWRSGQNSSPCVNQEILGFTYHIQLHPWLQPCDGYLRRVGWLVWAASVLLNHHEGSLALDLEALGPEGRVPPSVPTDGICSKPF